MNATDIAKLNACGRYLLVSVLRNACGDCSNDGITSRESVLYIPHPDGPFNLADMPEVSLILAVLPPAFEGCPIRVRPANASRGMAGGNFVYSSDARFIQLYKAPLSVHDRVE